MIFHDQASLDRLFPRLILHGILNLGCEQVMRFLGKQLNGRFGGEVVTDLRRRSEGVRLQHWVNDNSIKLYNYLNVLRPETTMPDAEDLKVYRTPENRPDGPQAWYPLRRGVADLYRRAQISRMANERYLTVLAAASVTTPLAQEAVTLCQPVRRQQRRYRALNPFAAADAQLVAAVTRGEWALKGFRNREIRDLLFGEAKDQKQKRSQVAKVSRRLALLHAHGVIAKVSRTYRWQVTAKGAPYPHGVVGRPPGRHGQTHESGSVKISSQPAKKRRGFPFAHCPIPGNSDLFRISSFEFRISGSAGLPLFAWFSVFSGQVPFSG